MEQLKEVTQEQHQKLKKLRRESAWYGAKLGLKASGLCILNNLLVVVVGSAFTIESQGFYFVGSMIGAFMIFSKLGQNIRKEHDRVRMEVKKILES